MKINKSIKRIFITIGILLLAVSIWIYYGLIAMDVEDRYGDLQNFYWDGKDGDIIFNKTNSEFGILEIEERRIYVLKNRKKLEIEEFLEYKPQDNNFWGFNAELYRSKNKIEINSLNENSLKEKLQNKELRLIEKVDVKY